MPLSLFPPNESRRKQDAPAFTFTLQQGSYRNSELWRKADAKISRFEISRDRAWKIFLKLKAQASKSTASFCIAPSAVSPLSSHSLTSYACNSPARTYSSIVRHSYTSLQVNEGRLHRATQSAPTANNDYATNGHVRPRGALWRYSHLCKT
jgi:hypothetical protein